MCVQVLTSVKDLVSQLEQGSAVAKEEGESIACQILLLTLLMEVMCS